MNQYFENLLLSSNYLKNCDIEIKDIAVYNKGLECSITSASLGDFDYRNDKCYIAETDKQIELLFLGEPMIIDDKIVVLYNREIYRMIDSDVLLYTYQKGKYIKEIDADYFPVEARYSCRIKGEVIRSNIQFSTVNHFINYVVQNDQNSSYIKTMKLDQQQIKNWGASSDMGLEELIYINAIMDTSRFSISR